MKNIDLSNIVMSRIAKIEKKRTRAWILRFSLMLVILTLILLGVLWVIAQDIMEEKTLELLQLFLEDREIIADYWQDTLSIFWQELPHWWLVVAFILTFIAVVYLLSSRKKQQLLRRKMKELDKYQEKR